MKKLFLFDVDGTLYDNPNKVIPKSTIKALKKLSKNKNYSLGVATGRSKGQIETIAPILKYFKYLILANGGVVYNNQKKIYNNHLSTEQVKKILDYSNLNDIGLALIAEDKFTITKSDDEIIASTRTFNLKIPEINQEFYRDNDIYQIWVFNEQKEVIEDYIKKFTDVTIYPWSKYGFDLVNKNVNKGDMALKLKEDLGYDQLITFGDGLNDLSLIKNADIGIVMGNSIHKELKKAATYVSNPIHEDGLYKILKELKFI